MIYLTVGTFPAGFDRLVKAVDDLCFKYRVQCVAQISCGKYIPKHMSYNEFCSVEEQRKYIENSEFVITHGGIGAIGDIMRQGKPMIVFPRLPEEAGHDQMPVSKRLSDTYGFSLCENINDLNDVFKEMLGSSNSFIDYPLGSNIPNLISDYLSNSC